jgi:hypothetical protein
MSRDLDRRAAQDQAMRTYDTRRAATTGQPAPGSFGNTTASRTGTTPPLPPLDPVVPGGRSGGNGGSNGAYAQHGAPSSGSTSAPAPVIVRDSSNGWLWGIGGFMLGRAASGHAAPAPAPAAQPAPAPVPTAQGDVSGNTGAMADAAGASDIAGAVVETARQQQVQAPAAKLAVALLIGGLVWLAWKAFRMMASAQQVKKNANYSFERN